MSKRRGGFRRVGASKKQTLEQWLRASLRSIWMVHPAKAELIKAVRYKLGQRFHVDCRICGRSMWTGKKPKDFEINHKEPCGNVMSEGYTERLLHVTKDDLEVLCKPCHGIVTYSETYGMSFEDAAIEKRVIAFGKLPSKEQKEWVQGVNQAERQSVLRGMLKAGIEPHRQI